MFERICELGKLTSLIKFRSLILTTPDQLASDRALSHAGMTWDFYGNDVGCSEMMWVAQ
jgi:hypothetical protein